MILDYLGAMLLHAAEARDAAVNMLSYDQSNVQARENFKYWDNVCSGIRFIGNLVTKRQKHLMVAKMKADGRLPA